MILFGVALQTLLIAPGIVLVAALLARAYPRDLDWLARALDSRWAPVVAGILSALAVWYVGGSLRMLPIIHDEWAYVLQAKIFAAGHWVEPPRPLPEFFQQMYIFATPFLGAKYPPGQSLVLVPGVMLGMPALGPIVMGGVSGALIYALARRITNAKVALLTWVIWVTTPNILNWYGSYFSEVTTAALFLGGWYGLLRVRNGGSDRWLILLGACTGLLAITRPLTAVAYAIPAAAVVLLLVRRRGTWRSVLSPLVAPLVVCLAIVAIMPLHNRAATGDWRLSPLVLYSQLYTPFDFPTLGYHHTGPLLSMPPDQEWLRQMFIRMRAEHTLDALPRIMLERVGWIARHTWGDWRLALAPFAILGLTVLTAEGWFALATSALLLLVYIVHSHDPQWTDYYLEVFAPLMFVTGLGVWRAIELVLRAPLRSGDAPAPSVAGAPRGAAFAASLAALALVAYPPGTIFPLSRAGHHSAERSHREWFAKLEKLPTPAMVFVRYNYKHHNTNITYVLNNDLDLRTAPIWTAYDRGDENAELIKLFPGRAAYLYDEKSDTFALIRR